MRSSAQGFLLGTAFVVGGCQSEHVPQVPSHIVVHIETDAVLLGASPTDQAPLFDHLRIEILNAKGELTCATCARELEATQELFLDGVSFTIEQSNAPRFVRITLAPSALDIQSTRIEVLGIVDDFPVSGGKDVSFSLRTETVGTPVGTLSEPLRAQVWTGPQLMPATWKKGSHRPCDTTGDTNVAKGSVCVPGGAFWMGLAPDKFDEYATCGTHLVVTEPFYMDTHEVSQSEWFEWATTPIPTIPTGDFYTGSGSSPCNGVPTHTIASMPITCVEYDRARAFCQARGGDLPTEAQYEYVLGGLRSQKYVWGSGEPSCDDAVLDRTRLGVSPIRGALCNDATLLSPAFPGVFTHGVSSPIGRDVLDIGGTLILDLAGNVAEWARDRYATSEDACWRSEAANILVDPECRVERDTKNVAFRGGHFGATAALARASARGAASRNGKYNEIGFRCVYPGRARPGN